MFVAEGCDKWTEEDGTRAIVACGVSSNWDGIWQKSARVHHIFYSVALDNKLYVALMHRKSFVYKILKSLPSKISELALEVLKGSPF